MTAEAASPGGRAGLMGASLANTARAAGLSPPEVEAVSRVFALAVEPRVGALPDDHHPAYLHPGRTALVLLNDLHETDAAVLTVAMLHESRDVALRVPIAEVVSRVGRSAAEAIESVPLPGDEALVERLLRLGPGVARAALAEQLDHLRHLHLRGEWIDAWADVHAEVAGAWLPFAARIHPLLTRRYAHWVRTFAERI